MVNKVASIMIFIVVLNLAMFMFHIKCDPNTGLTIALPHVACEKNSGFFTPSPEVFFPQFWCPIDGLTIGTNYARVD